MFLAVQTMTPEKENDVLIDAAVGKPALWDPGEPIAIPSGTGYVVRKTLVCD